MTLREIKYLLDSADLTKPMFSLNEGLATGLIDFRKRMATLEKLPLYDKEKKALKESIIYRTFSDGLKESGLNGLLNTAESLRRGALILSEALACVLPQQDEKTVFIKLPESQDLEQVIAYLSEIQKVIAQNITNPHIGGKIELRSWQPGPLSIDLSLGSIAALNLIGGLTWAAAVVLKKRHEAQIMEKMADSMDIKNEMLDNLRRGVEAHIQLVIESEAQNLLTRNFPGGENHEQVERLKMGIKSFVGLIEQGAEIHPALSAPESAKKLFPDFKQLETIESTTKLQKQTPDESVHQPESEDSIA